MTRGLGQVALQLARVRRSRIGGRRRLQLVHAIESRERLVVLTKLEAGVANEAVDVRIVGSHREATGAFTERVRGICEVRGTPRPAAGALRNVGITSERGRQHPLSFDRSSPVSGHARLTQEDVAQGDGRGNVAGILLEVSTRAIGTAAEFLSRRSGRGWGRTQADSRRRGWRGRWGTGGESERGDQND
jgi:hypothetical protein